MSKIFAVAALVSAAGYASAGLVHELVLNEDVTAVLGPDYVTFDLLVTVTGQSSFGDNQWTTSAAEAILVSGTFYEHPVGQDFPQPAFWGVFPELEFDSFYANAEGFNAGVSFAGAVINQPQYRDAVWFGTPPNGGNVVNAVIARYTIFAPDWDGSSLGTLTGRSFDAEDPEIQYTFSYEFIPAPGSVALLGLAGLISRRRR